MPPHKLSCSIIRSEAFICILKSNVARCDNPQGVADLSTQSKVDCQVLLHRMRDAVTRSCGNSKKNSGWNILVLSMCLLCNTQQEITVSFKPHRPPVCRLLAKRLTTSTKKITIRNIIGTSAVPPKVTLAIKQINSNCKRRIKTEDEDSVWFTAVTRVTGDVCCSLSSLH